MLTVAKFPLTIFADNPIEFIFRKKNILSATGGYASFSFVIRHTAGLPPFSDAPNNNETLIFDIGGGASAITFNFVGADEEEDTLDFYVPFMIPYVAELARQIYRHPDIKKNYYVTSLGYNEDNDFAVISIKARKRGTAYNIDIHPDSTVSYFVAGSGPVTVATDDVALENYKLKLRATLKTDLIYCQTEKEMERQQQMIIKYNEIL